MFRVTVHYFLHMTRPHTSPREVYRTHDAYILGVDYSDAIAALEGSKDFRNLTDILRVTAEHMPHSLVGPKGEKITGG